MKGKEAEEARRFVETFALDGEGEDALRRSLNMLREAKGNGRIGRYLVHGSKGQNGMGAMEAQYVADIEIGGSVFCTDGDYSQRALFVSACVVDDIKRLPEAVRRALRAVDELKPLVVRCDFLRVSTGRMFPVMRMDDVRRKAFEAEGCDTYAEIGERP